MCCTESARLPLHNTHEGSDGDECLSGPKKTVDQLWFLDFSKLRQHERYVRSGLKRKDPLLPCAFFFFFRAPPGKGPPIVIS